MFEEIKTIDDVSVTHYPEADYGALVHLVELKKMEAKQDVWAEEFELRVDRFKKEKKLFLIFSCAIASVVGTIVGVLVFWGLSQ